MHPTVVEFVVVDQYDLPVAGHPIQLEYDQIHNLTTDNNGYAYYTFENIGDNASMSYSYADDSGDFNKTIVVMPSGLTIFLALYFNMSTTITVGHQITSNISSSSSAEWISTSWYGVLYIIGILVAIGVVKKL